VQYLQKGLHLHRGQQYLQKGQHLQRLHGQHGNKRRRSGLLLRNMRQRRRERKRERVSVNASL
jgi:hypothetical protein